LRGLNGRLGIIGLDLHISLDITLFYDHAGLVGPPRPTVTRLRDHDDARQYPPFTAPCATPVPPHTLDTRIVP
jgi:hypothetical protein